MRVFFLIPVLMLIACSTSQPPADSVFYNGIIYTVDDSRPGAGSMAVRDGKFVYIGETVPDALIGPETRKVDLQGAFVTPGFNDSHLHFMDGGFSLFRIDLRNTGSREEFVARIAEHVADIPKGEWILGGNWDHTLWAGQTLPDRDWIDAITPDNPVFINRLDGHMALANSKALELAGIGRDAATPPGGEVDRDSSGRLTGIMRDAAMYLVRAAIPPFSPESMRRAALLAQQHLFENGFTSVQDMGLWSHVETYRELYREGKLKIRIAAFPPIAEWEKLGEYRPGDADSLVFRVRGVKGFMDGSLGSSTARFFKPYKDNPDTRGIWDENYIPPEKMRERISGAAGLGYPSVVHAIGTEANHEILELFHAVSPASKLRFRVEHAQHLLKGDITRFAEYGIIAAMQPYHCIDDGRWADGKIDAETRAGTYAFRDLIDQGAVVAFGSDWDVAPVSPLWGIYAAVTRRTLDNKNPDGWIPEQKISVEEAIRCYTVNSAFAENADNYKGSITPGKVADFVVLSADLRKIEPEMINSVDVLYTYLAGDAVYVKKMGNNQ
jgi:predicted amidohydrolase YtcJ